MHRNVRAASTLGAIAASAVLLTACSAGGSGSGDESSTLTYMSYWTEGEPTSDILKEAITDFTKETGITVDVQWQGRDLPDVLTPMLSSSKPKVDMVDFGCSAVQSKLQTIGRAADLSSVLDAAVADGGKSVAEVLSADAVATGVADGKAFCIPFESTSNFDIWYNAATHPELAAAPPETWDEFTALLEETGAGSLALDGTIAPYSIAYFVNLAVSGTGKGGLLEASQDKTGEMFKDDPAFLNAAKALEALAKSGAFSDGYSASKFPAIQQKWANNDADFILNGSWLPAEVAPYAAPGFEYASFPFPAIAEGKDRPMQLDTIGFAALEGSANVENAKKFIAFFLQKKYQDQIGEIAVPVRIDASANASLAGVQAALNDPTVTKIAPGDGINAMGGTFFQDVLDPLGQKLIFGELSANDFITQLSENTATYWANQG